MAYTHQDHDDPRSYEKLTHATEQEIEHDAAQISSADGRVEISTDSRLFRTLSKIYREDVEAEPRISSESHVQSLADDDNANVHLRLNICIQVVGSRGDVQPFVALGTELARRGHRVRIATHNIFDSLIRTAGLEFYPVGGDPMELMAYMVKNPGLIPSMESLRAGDVAAKRKMVAEMLDGFWKSCSSTDPQSAQPFLADAIIANPPSFAHVHCGQALGIPVHIMFTMPWTKTRSFPHPLAQLNIENPAIPLTLANYVSYAVVDWITWQGLHDVINKWRSTLDLDPVPRSEGHRLVDILNIPHTYCWSSALIPKPKDWGDHIDVCGFFFRDMPSYSPTPDVERFLSQCPSNPIYIGFGSIVVDDPEKLTTTILTALKVTGQKAIIQRGWSKLGGARTSDSDVFYLDDCPHEWLFQHVSMVIHHGGAGTTACGLRNERPTVIIPFFGDQPFWGKMVAEAGAGPLPVSHHDLTSESLVESIEFCMRPETQVAAQTMAKAMQQETGVINAADSFLSKLPLEEMRCDLIRGYTASLVVKTKGKAYKISNVAAALLLEAAKIKEKKLQRYESKPIYIENVRWEPISATTSSLIGTSTQMATSSAEIIWKPIAAFVDSKKASRTNSLRSDVESETSRDTNDSNEQIPANSPNPYLKAAKGSAKGIAGVVQAFSVGALVDMPVAVTEGLRSMPRLYGREVPKQREVKDWKSGTVVAAKNFAYGWTSGIGDLYNEPAKGAKKDGVPGFIIGSGIGVSNFISKTSSGLIGLVAYSGQGVMKSVVSLAGSRRQDELRQAALAQGRYDLMIARNRGLDEDAILHKFEVFSNGKK